MDIQTKEETLELMIFVIEAVVLDTKCIGSIEIGMYLLSLILAEFEASSSNNRYELDGSGGE